MSLHVDRPTFHLDEDDSDIELWSVRVPRRFDTKSLDGLEIELDSGKPVGFTGADGNQYRLEEGETAGRDCFRLLIPWDGSGDDDKHNNNKDGDDDSDDSDDSDDDDKKKKKDSNTNKAMKDKGYNLQPTNRPFVRHFDVTANFERLDDRQVAPLKGPEPVGTKMRHAYATVPQRTGLKRRWMPPGAKPVPRETKQIKYVAYGEEEENSNDSSNNNNGDSDESPTTTPTPKKRQRDEAASSTGQSKEEKRSQKKARKAEKKAKKEEKKALKKEKKAEKKARKSLDKTPDVDV